MCRSRTRPLRSIRYERVYRQVVDAKYGQTKAVTGFGIGGGAFTFPRYLEEFHHGHTVVAEIDKEVTEIAHEDFYFETRPASRSSTRTPDRCCGTCRRTSVSTCSRRRLR